MTGLLLALLLTASAEEPVATPVDGADTEEDADEVVIVESLREARKKVIESAKDAGYTEEVRKDGRTILRSPDAWKGEFVIWDSGQITFKRQPVLFQPPGGTKNKANYAWCIFFPACLRTSGQTVGQRIFRSNERAALAAVEPEIVAFQERIGDVAVDERINRLPEKLGKLWADGTPLDPGPALETYDDRRAAIFAYWNSRTETEWGERVRDAVEAFVRGEIQGSEHPFTPDEIARLNARRTVAREFLAPKVVATGDE